MGSLHNADFIFVWEDDDARQHSPVARTSGQRKQDIAREDSFRPSEDFNSSGERPPTPMPNKADIPVARAIFVPSNLGHAGLVGQYQARSDTRELDSLIDQMQDAHLSRPVPLNRLTELSSAGELVGAYSYDLHRRHERDPVPGGSL